MAGTLQTALIVDDDHLEREYLSELLLRNGFVVRAAASVSNAAALTRTMRFDCFFIDDRLFGCDGAAALKELLRTGAAGNGTQTAFLMGDAHEEGAKHHKENGFLCFLEKPVDVGRLQELLGAPAPAAEVSSVDGLDERGGIANCGSREGYLAALRIFYDTLDTKAGEIARRYEEEDWKNYTIKVHALKSSARIIGATALSQAAADLEAAGNRGDVQEIRAKTAALLADYRAYKEKIAPFLGADEGSADREKADAETVADARRSIAEFAEQMDYDLVEMVLKSLEEYRLEEEDAARFARVKTALLALDWDGVLREVR